MDINKEKLEVSNGALVILSKSPLGCNLKRNLEDNSVWLPQLIIALPEKRKPFIIDNGGIKRRKTPYTIIRENGGSIWWNDKDIREKLITNVFLLEKRKGKC